MAHTMEQNINTDTHRTILAAGSSLVGSIGAIIGSSCCVLPLVLFNLGVGSGVIAQLAFFLQYRQIFLGVAIVMIAGAAFLAMRGRKTLTYRSVLMITLAAIFVVAAFITPFYERDLLVLFGFRGT